VRTGDLRARSYPGRQRAAGYVAGTWFPVTVALRGILRLGVRAACAALALAGCGPSAAPVGSGQRGTRPSPPASRPVPAAASCASRVLVVRAGREGENQGVHADAGFTNAGQVPCVLRGLPAVAVLTMGGRVLPAHPARAAQGTDHAARRRDRHRAVQRAAEPRCRPALREPRAAVPDPGHDRIPPGNARAAHLRAPPGNRKTRSVLRIRHAAGSR